MPRTKGARQVGAEIDAVLLGSVKEFAKSRRETFREVLEMALRRHLANPPPIQAPPPPPPLIPLPPFPPTVDDAAGKPASKKRGKAK